MTDPIGSDLAASLVAALGDMQNVTTDARADAGQYSYTYASLAAVLAVARPVLAAHGLALLTPVADAGQQVEVTALFVHASGETFLAGRLLLPRGSTVQQTGSAISYGRRYCALAALGIATEDDDGTSAGEHPATVPTDPQDFASGGPEPAGGHPVAEDRVRALWARVRDEGSADAYLAARLRAAAADQRVALTERTLADFPRFADLIECILDAWDPTAAEVSTQTADDDQAEQAEQADDRLATPKQIRTMGAGFTAVDIKERAERLNLIAAIIGRPVTTSRACTRAEATKVIIALNQLAAGIAQLAWDDAGDPVITLAVPESVHRLDAARDAGEL